MSPRLKCRRCPAMILPLTAEVNAGYCGTCARTRRTHPPMTRLWNALVIAGDAVLFPVWAPVTLLFILLRRQWRRFRFPFDRKALRAALWNVHSGRVASAYYSGVINGYWENTQGILIWAQNRPYTFGRMDGGKLRRGEIAYSDIPTRREKEFIG